MRGLWVCNNRGSHPSPSPPGFTCHYEYFLTKKAGPELHTLTWPRAFLPVIHEPILPLKGAGHNERTGTSPAIPGH